MCCYLIAYPLGKKMFFAPQPEPGNGLVEPGTWHQVIQLVILFAYRAFAFVLAPPEESETCQRVILQVTWFILYVIRIVFWVSIFSVLFATSFWVVFEFVAANVTAFYAIISRHFWSNDKVGRFNEILDFLYLKTIVKGIANHFGLEINEHQADQVEMLDMLIFCLVNGACLIGMCWVTAHFPRGMIIIVSMAHPVITWLKRVAQKQLKQFQPVIQLDESDVQVGQPRIQLDESHVQVSQPSIQLDESDVQVSQLSIQLDKSDVQVSQLS